MGFLEPAGILALVGAIVCVVAAATRWSGDEGTGMRWPRWATAAAGLGFALTSVVLLNTHHVEQRRESRELAQTAAARIVTVQRSVWDREGRYAVTRGDLLRADPSLDVMLDPAGPRRLSFSASASGDTLAISVAEPREDLVIVRVVRPR